MWLHCAPASSEPESTPLPPLHRLQEEEVSGCTETRPRKSQVPCLPSQGDGQDASSTAVAAPPGDIRKCRQSFCGSQNSVSRATDRESVPTHHMDQSCPKAPRAVEECGALNSHPVGPCRAVTGPRPLPRGPGQVCPVLAHRTPKSWAEARPIPPVWEVQKGKSRGTGHGGRGWGAASDHDWARVVFTGAENAPKPHCAGGYATW